MRQPGSRDIKGAIVFAIMRNLLMDLLQANLWSADFPYPVGPIYIGLNSPGTICTRSMSVATLRYRNMRQLYSLSAIGAKCMLWSLVSAVFVYLPRGCLAGELTRGNSHNAISPTEFFVFTNVSLDRVQEARRLGKECKSSPDLPNSEFMI